MLRALVLACVVAVSLSGALCSQAHAGSSKNKKTDSRFCSLWVLDVHKNGHCWRAGPFPTQSKANQAACWIRNTYHADVSAPHHPCDNNDNTEE